MSIAVRFVRESDVEDERVREAFRNVKASLRMPTVNGLFQAYASAPRFLDVAWRRLRPSLLAASFVDRSRRVGAIAESGIASWPIADHAALLHARNLSEGDLRRMREIADLFRQVNPKLLIVALAVDGALAGESVGGVGSPGPRHPGDSDDIGYDYRTLVMPSVEEGEAPLRVRTIFEDLKAVTGNPFVSGDYRAMATSPDWLEVWWRDCKPAIADPRYAVLCRAILDESMAAANELPYRLTLSQALLAINDVDAAERARLAAVNKIFCDMLPGLIVNTAIARKGLGPQPA
jgi:hypothetical protein